MKVLLVGNFTADAQFSMQGFIHALAQGLPAQGGMTVKVIVPMPLLSRQFKDVQRGMGKWLAYIDKYVLFPPRLRRAAREVDLVHICDQGNGIYVSQLGNRTPLLLTCHDLFAVRAGHDDPQTWPLSRTGKIYQRLIWRGIRRAPHIACDSEATRQDLTNLLRSDAFHSTSNVICLPLGLFRPYERMSEAASQEIMRDECDVNPGQSFLLHVGGNQPYKNRLGLLKIYAALCRENSETPPLVLAGKPLTPEMRRYIAENNLADKVWERTGLNDRTLHALYSQAKALIFPSTMEGFGLPIIESQACGCPVFTTGRPPMSEIGGDAAVYFDPQDTEGAARIISQTLNDTDKLQEMKVAGLANVAAHFTTERMVADYRTLYEQILMRSGRDN